MTKSPAPQRGRYVLGELLGRGGMGEVFSGHAYGSHGFQKPVAIKRILPGLANDEVFVKRLIGEAKLLVGIQHSNIVSVLDLTRESNDVFLVMEFVDGPSLYQLLKARGARTLPFGIASYIIQSAAAGLQFAHARKGGAIIHADISPSNLLLSTSGEVRVADFGIAQREGRASTVEGKCGYMAPEQLRGDVLTPRVDVFGLGIVLYEMLTGQQPFGSNATYEQRMAGMQIAPPGTINSDVPIALEQICMRALAEDPAERIATMQELIDALVDLRYANQWREGASELATAIAEAPVTGAQPAGTQVTSHPVTIVSKSLIGGASSIGGDLGDMLGLGDEPTDGSTPVGEGSDLAPTGLFVVPETFTEKLSDSQIVAETAAKTAVVVAETAAKTAVKPAIGDVEPSITRPFEPIPESGALVAPAIEPPVVAPAIEPEPRAGIPRKYIAYLVAAILAGIVIAIAVSDHGTTPAVVALAPPDGAIGAVAIDAEAPLPIDIEPDAGAEARPTGPIDAVAADAVVEPVDAAVAVAIVVDAGVPAIDAGVKIKPHVPTPPIPLPVQTGWLRVVTSDGSFAKASLRSETFDIPGASFKVKPGSNVVTVKNASATHTCDVSFKPGSQTLTVSMKSGKCTVR